MRDMETDLIQRAQIYAEECHNSTNHFYDKVHPYTFHLRMVVDIAQAHIHLIPEDERNNVIAGCWTHDIIEDTRQSYNDVKKKLNETVANLSYALTNEKGKIRNERANDKYYEGIRKTPYGIFIKVCDRIANVKYSKEKGTRMFDKYKEENNHFVKALYDSEYDELFKTLLTLMDT